jgi:uncharacterized protein (TIGR03435 family)
MRRAALGIILIACAVPAVHAQSAGGLGGREAVSIPLLDHTIPLLEEQMPAFEVASVKPGAPPTPVAGSDGRAMMIRSGCSGGPGSSDPGRYTCQSATLTSIIANAYELKQYQYSFPSWMESAYFEIAAKVPADATKEQFRLMKQNLLAERFKLAAHFEKRDTQVYELVAGKDGTKLKEAQPEPQPAPDAKPQPLDFGKLQRDGDGIPIMPRRAGASVLMMSGANGIIMRMQGAQTMEQLASTLAGQLGRPVTDATGLTGKYDVTLTCTPPDSSGFRMISTSGSPDAAPSPAQPDAAPSIFVAIQQQLGLKLEQKKSAVDFLVVDHVEKTPLQN